MKTKTRILESGRKFWVLILFLILVVALGVLQFTHMVHFFGSTSKPNTTYYPGPHTPTGGQNTKGQANNVPSIVQSNPSPKTSPNGQPTTTGSSNAVLITPTGDFVNSHNIQQSTSMFSDCNTTPGATCDISFTNVNTGATVSLTAQPADSNGAAYWTWTPKQIGLAVGTWRTTATAALNGQSKSTADAMDLKVGQ